ncbi:MAG: hypothetical protein BWY76_02697 [bacterium ADurb.Bin429]|nr:MAG: hypothetical protein BWY76_02697 [bacterium ADurb.Bin429]
MRSPDSCASLAHCMPVKLSTISTMKQSGSKSGLKTSFGAKGLFIAKSMPARSNTLRVKPGAMAARMASVSASTVSAEKSSIPYRSRMAMRNASQ